MKGKICVGVSNDYASLTIGDVKFYYGYEEFDPKTDEWCYITNYDGKEIKVPASKLSPNDHWDCAKMLLLGIGNTFHHQILKEKHESMD